MYQHYNKLNQKNTNFIASEEVLPLKQYETKGKGKAFTYLDIRQYWYCSFLFLRLSVISFETNFKSSHFSA